MNVKKLLAVVLAVVMLLGVLPVVYAAGASDSANPEDGDISVDIGDVETVPEETESDSILGDINGDGEITTVDLVALQASVTKKGDPIANEIGDINADGEVTTVDLVALQAYVTKKVPTLG